MSHDRQYAPLTPGIIRGLSDKLYDKRKNSALEIERLVKSLGIANDFTSIRKILTILQDDFAFSSNANCRKGGLIGLAAIAIALGQFPDSIAKFLPELAPPVLGCFTDIDARVRYYACEAMYNISKVARLEILTFFNRLFVGLFKLTSDPDPSVKNGAELLDRLIKDIVNEDSGAIDMETFLPLLQERVYTQDPNNRQFIVSWIQVLEGMPDLNMIVYLPTLLEGLFRILSDPNLEIRRMCEALLGEFLRKVDSPRVTNFQAMVRIVLRFCISDDRITKLMAISWLHNFTSIGKEQMQPYMSEILGAVLPAVSYSVDAKLRELASATNENLMELIRRSNPATLVLSPESPAATESSMGEGAADADGGNVTSPDSFNIASMIIVLTLQLLHDSVATRMASLRWFDLLHSRVPKVIAQHVDEFVPALLKILSDPSEKVVAYALKVMATLSLSRFEVLEEGSLDTQADLEEVADTFFNRIMADILRLFKEDRELFEQRGSFIIRRLATFIDANKIFRKLAGVLEKEEDLLFAGLMTQMLNLILLTAPELFVLRQQLKSMKTEESQSFFRVLFTAWCHSPVSTYALCLLAQQYEHCCGLLQKFSELEVTVTFLVEIDKLIQLLESPVFTFLRLQLLEPQRYAYLVKALYGLLMLMPQTEAYRTLKNRLDCIPTIVLSLELLKDEELEVFKGSSNASDVDFDQLLAHFDAVQELHNVVTAEGRTSRKKQVAK
eukprot:m.190038 g.190038  ORF g.190038 m.190038 type:complete len:727 (-) comp24873_c0_seq1:1284-3464(-)